MKAVKFITKAMLTIMAMICIAAAYGDELPNAPTPKPAASSAPVLKPVLVSKDNRTGSYLFFADTATCGVGIALSGNRTRSAEVGLPIWLGLNLLAHKIHGNHPKLSYFLQVVSPAGCFAGIDKTRKSVAPTGNGQGGDEGGITDPGGIGGGNGGGNNGGGSNGGGSGGGSNGGGGTGGDGGGGGTGGSGGGSGGGNGGGICIQDCGFGGPNGGGNGGINGGNDGKKPPFPGVGRKSKP